MKKVKWKQINWEQAETYINRLQIRIVKDVKENKWRLVKRLQYLITHSFYGKAVAVRRVISNKGTHQVLTEQSGKRTKKRGSD